MGIEGRDKQKALEAGAVAVVGAIGQDACSGCARPITCRCPNFPSNPASPSRSSARSSATRPIRRWPRSGVWRRRWTSPSNGCLRDSDDSPFIEKLSRGDTPILVSDDGKCRLAITGWIKTVEWLQCYDFSADPGGVLESDAHQRGAVECLSPSRRRIAGRGRRRDRNRARRAKPCATAPTART